MFVCLGNICRSPAAEAVCRYILKKRGIEDGVTLTSSGTCAYHVGDPPDRRMQEAALKRGISIRHRSRQLKVSDLDEHDLVLAMDRENYLDILSLALNDRQRKKAAMFRDYDPEGPGDVADPYYGGRRGFELVMDMLVRTCEELVREIEEKRRA